MEARLPPIQFKGALVEIKNHGQVAPAIARLLRDSIWADAPEGAPKRYVGFDMEWKPEFRAGQSHPIALIQLASENVCLIFYMLKLVTMPNGLLDLLMDKSILKLGIGVNTDLLKLRTQYSVTPHGLLDVACMARQLGYYRLGLKSLADEVLGLHMAKGAARSNWAQPTLTPQQLIYAALDPYATLLLYNELEAIEVEDELEPYWRVVQREDQKKHHHQHQQVHRLQCTERFMEGGHAYGNRHNPSTDSDNDEDEDDDEDEDEDEGAYDDEDQGVGKGNATLLFILLDEVETLRRETQHNYNELERRIAALEAENRRLRGIAPSSSPSLPPAAASLPSSASRRPPATGGHSSLGLRLRLPAVAPPAPSLTLPRTHLPPKQQQHRQQRQHP